MALQVRPAQLGDVPGIFHVRTSVNENVLSHAELAEMGITDSAVSSMIARRSCAWVALQGDELIGFSMIDQDEGALFAVFVLPAYEGRGVGRRLLALAERELFTQHAVAWLETRRDSRAAGFYRRLGWADEQDAGHGDIRLQKHRP